MADKKYFSDDNFAYFWQKLKTILENKVSKENGKGLSTNDFSNDEKAKVTNSYNYIENTLKTWIAEIENLIPEEATSSNQLADKGFVNSSIATNTAVFRGTYETTSSLPAKTTITDLRDNDYAFIVTTDANGNPEYQRYKYTISGGWVFEYTLNNSSFTAEQWASIQSGITSALVAQITTNKNNINTLDSEKEDKTNLGDLAYKDSLSKSEVGLGNVDNTSDANKPISTATQAALNQKASASDVEALSKTVTSHGTSITWLNNNAITKSGEQEITGLKTLTEGLKLGSGGLQSGNYLSAFMLKGGNYDNPNLNKLKEAGIYHCSGGTNTPTFNDAVGNYTLFVFDSGLYNSSGEGYAITSQMVLNQGSCWLRWKYDNFNGDDEAWNSWERFGEGEKIQSLTNAEIDEIFDI